MVLMSELVSDGMSRCFNPLIHFQLQIKIIYFWYPTDVHKYLPLLIFI